MYKKNRRGEQNMNYNENEKTRMIKKCCITSHENVLQTYTSIIHLSIPMIAKFKVNQYMQNFIMHTWVNEGKGSTDISGMCKKMNTNIHSQSRILLQCSFNEYSIFSTNITDVQLNIKLCTEYISINRFQRKRSFMLLILVFWPSFDGNSIA